jgi:hypothetical protein
MKKFLVLLVSGLAALAGAADTLGGSSRTCRLIYMQAPLDAPEKVVLVVGKDTTDVDLPRLSISSARAKLPAGPVRVYAATKAPTKTEPLPADAPFVDIPEAMSDVLIVLLPNGQPGPLSFIMLPVEFSKSRAPEGSSMWFNLSDRIIYSKTSDRVLTINPKASALEIHKGGVDEPYYVSIDASPVPPEVENVPIYRGYSSNQARTRHLLFVVPDPTRIVPRILSISDRLDPEPDLTPKGGNGKAAPKPATKPKEEKKEATPAAK